MTVLFNRLFAGILAVFLFFNVAAKLPVITKRSPFDHDRKEHKAPCDSCHYREASVTATKFPGHTMCINCHVADFTSTSSELCATCHKVPLDANADVKAFPAKMTQFGLHSFSHRDHLDPAKLKKETRVPTCESCHKFDAAGNKAIFPNHPECYGCHEHAAESKKGSCDTCHASADVSLHYSTMTGRATTEYKFLHGNHFKANTIQKDCKKCHATNPAAGAKEIDVLQFEPVPDKIAHNSSCWQTGCHVTQKETRCGKCHVRPPVQIQISST